MTITTARHFAELRWLRRQLKTNAYGLDAATVAYLLERQDHLERRAVEENALADLAAAVRGDNAVGAYLAPGDRLRRHEENAYLAAKGWVLPWDADADEPSTIAETASALDRLEALA